MLRGYVGYLAIVPLFQGYHENDALVAIIFFLETGGNYRGPIKADELDGEPQLCLAARN
jgi:hypothetical protein